MAQNNQLASSEENTPPTPVYYQPSMTQALPPLTPAGAPPVHSGEIPPPVPTSEAQAPSTSTEGAARIVALEGDISTLRGTVNQMAADMAELMALLRAPNRTSSNSTPPPGYGPTVDPNPWVPPTHAPEGIEAPAIHAPAGLPANVPPPSVTLPAAIPLPPSNPTTLVPPPMSIPVPAPVYAAPPPMVFPAQSPHAPAHTAEPVPFQAPQPHISFSYPTLPPLNIPIPEPGTPTQAVPIAPPTNFLPEMGTEQEQRLKKMEENIKALQSGGPRLDAGDCDWSLFPGMRLPPKIKVPEFQRYHGTTDPRHHLRHYRGKMLQYWDYEEFVIHTFQDSLAGAALDWYMSLKAADIPTWTDLSGKFIDQYKYCAETPPTLLELSTMEMAEDQGFEAYAVKWRARAAKHVPPISEAQQIQLFHSTLKGAYYLHLLAHTSSFSNLIDAGKKLDIGVKLGKIEGPAEKKEGESSKKVATGTPSAGNRRGKDASVNAVNSGRQAPQQYSINYTPAPPTTQAYAPPPVHYQQQLPAQQVYYSAPPASFPLPAPHNYVPIPPPIQQSRPPASRTPQPVQRAPAPQDQQSTAPRRRQFTPLPAPLSHIYRQLLAGNRIKSVAPNPDFDPTIQDQSRHCEYHQGAPGHTTDDCWKLREKIQAMIDGKQLTFNAVKPPNVQVNPLPDHGSSSGPSINMISVCAIGEYETGQEPSAPFVIEYVPAETGIGYAGFDATPAPFVIDVPAREPYQDSKVPWTYEGSVGNLERQFSVMGVTRSGRVYENPEVANKGKAPAATLGIAPEATPIPQKKVTEEEAEAFMKIIKASEYKVVEQMGKSPAHISLLALLLSSEPHREALLKVLTAAQVPKETAPDLIEETVGRVMIDNGSALNVCPVSTLKQMNVDLNRIRPSKTAVRAFDGSRREVNGEIDLLIEVGPCSFNVTFQVLDIPNAFSLLLGRPWIHFAGAVPSTLHQKLKFIVEERLITVKGEEDYAIYKETAVPYIIEPTEEINIGTEEEPRTLKIGTGLDPTQRARMIDFLKEYQEVFAWSYADMPGLDPSIVKHSLPLDTENFPPKRQHLRRQRAGLLLRIKEEVVKQINAGFLEVCNYSEWVANIVPVEKKDGRVRVCVDYRDLNKASPKDNFPLPHIDVLVDNTARHNQFSFMDGFSGYNQIRMAEDDKIKTTFITMWGTFCYKVMPFGLKNAGATYQRAMVTLFHDMMHKEIEVYVDDMIAKSKEGEDHLVNLRRLFERLKKYKLRLNPAKCTFGAKSGKLLGFVVSERGIEVDPDKVKAIRELPPPSTVREVRSFLGRLNYIARFIANLSDKCQPLFRLLRKNAAIEWDDDCQKAFDDIKTYLVQSPVLVPPTPGRPLILYLTVRRQSLGCMLGQEDESTRAEHAIYYLSKKFTEGESNYPEIEKMCCALVWVMQRLRQYTLYHTIRLLSKADPLKYLLGSPSSMRNIAKWRCQLTEYDIEYVPRTSVKGQAIADHLAEFPIEDDTPINSDFPDEGILRVDEEEDGTAWKMYFDGAVNSTGSGIGAVLISPDGRYYPIAAKVNFLCTNNVAEYEACILGLQAAIDFKVKELEVFGDSMLTIFQTLGQWKTKDAKLVPYHEYLEELAENFEKISFTYTPRIKNQFADALATLASMVSITKENLIEPLEIEIAKGPAYYWPIPDICQPSGRKTLRRLTAHYFLSGETLYRRSFDATLLRCVDENEAQRLMGEIHEGSCGPHMSGLMLTKKLMRLGYFWSTMEADCAKHVRHCHLCQVYADQIKAPPNELRPMAAPWPFSMWGIDVIGPINPKASNGHMFILVAIDYFTKWIEAITLASVTANAVARFLKRDIIARYGVPETIITDNAKNLNNRIIDELCERFKIHHRNSTPYRPQMNGAVEAANKNIKRIIEKMTVTYKDWHEMLPFALLAYRTSIRTSTGATPYSLVYGMEAILPIEVEIPSMRVLAESKLEEAEWAKQRYEQLNLIDEKRLTALCHGQCYQQRMARAFNARVRHREFRPGDLVLRKVLHITPDSRGKFAYKYDGPFVVREVFSGGAIILSDMDGTENALPVNADALKKYYP
ncbi:uncharacterized protein LOC116190138 [Punica granatum]|uniref:Uncharacterized protein LOC116190138 n=1 Tax=Punica granatum TaxID=22663 RepID=A0A6P8BX99_PUNGR|nr:uncharacterized protein LOC116190138 [Punica granatum]